MPQNLSFKRICTIGIAYLIGFLLVISIPSRTFAQDNCGTDMMHQHLMNSDSSYRNSFMRNQAELRQMIKKIAADKRAGKTVDQVYTIPVVVHIIHLGEPIGTGTNISDAQVLSAIDGLNQRYANTIGNSLDIEIKFCLASRDPNGCFTTGINRVNGTGITNYQANGITWGTELCGGPPNEADAKNLSRWPVSDYYNIWVVNKICSGLGGYAYYPSGHAYDGTIITYGNMSFSSTVLAHEIGHGFNLFHTFQGDANNQCPVNTDCSVNGDMICDTPPHRQSDCSITQACGSSGVWINSYRNYMSYCVGDRFTPDQKNRMRATLLVEPRSRLLNSLACTPTDFGTLVVKSNVTCHGLCNGYISVAPGCSSTYTYNWNNGATTPIISGLCAGTYSVTITNAQNLTHHITVNITEPNPLSLSPSSANVLCFGENNGSASVTASGGTSVSCGTGFLSTIGTGNIVESPTNYPAPFGNFKSSAKHQMLYLASELREQGFTGGKIYSIALNVASVPGTDSYPDFQIRMGTTAVGSMLLVTDAINLTTVYARGVTITSGWNTFNFITPFIWDGISNIVVETCFNNQNATLNAPTFSTRTFFPSTGFYAEDASSVCTEKPNAFSFNRPNMRFRTCNDSSYYNYAWSNGQTSSSITDLAPGNYSVIVTDGNNCSANASFTIVQPQQILSPQSISGNSSVCAASLQTYTATPVTGATAYSWQLPAGWTGNSTANTISAVAGNSGGVISVKAIVNSCSGNSQAFNVSVDALPAQPVAIAGNTLPFVGQTNNYSIAATANATGYNWSLPSGGVITSGQNTNGITVNWQSPGTHQLSVTASNSCGISASRNLDVNVSVATSVINADDRFQIQIVPNPTHGQFYLNAHGLINQHITIEVFNVLGQMVYLHSQDVRNNDINQLLSLSNLANGLYRVKIRIGKNVYGRNVLKQ